MVQKRRLAMAAGRLLSGVCDFFDVFLLAGQGPVLWPVGARSVHEASGKERGLVPHVSPRMSWSWRLLGGGV